MIVGHAQNGSWNGNLCWTVTIDVWAEIRVDAANMLNLFDLFVAFVAAHMTILGEEQGFGVETRFFEVPRQIG